MNKKTEYMKIKDDLEKYIVKYIDDNVYLFLTDNLYTINCNLKPRLVSCAVESACHMCKKKYLLDNCNEKHLKGLFMHSIVFATKYVNSRKV